MCGSQAIIIIIIIIIIDEIVRLNFIESYCLQILSYAVNTGY